MTRVALVSSEPIRPAMGGIGIRYLEIARRLPAAGLEATLFSPAAPGEAEAAGLAAAAHRTVEPGRLGAELARFDAVLAQGQLGNDVVAACAAVPVAIDLYDPWLVENLHYRASLGLDPYRNDHASWVLQLARGDFFLCSSLEERLFVLGFLAALGRVNPESVAADPDLDRLAAVVPFGVAEPPPHRPVLPPRGPGERRLLFGGLYDWYDPWTALAAVERLGVGSARLLFVRHPNPEGTPQRLLAELEERAARASGAAIETIDWVPAERRFDLLRDVDAIVVTHRPGLETTLSLRTRILDALAAGCPVVATAGGALPRLLAERAAGWVVPPGDVAAVAAAIRDATEPGAAREARRESARRLAAEFAWERVLVPLVDFLRAPRVDPAKEGYAFRPATIAPPDALGFRLRRFLSRRGPRSSRRRDSR